MQNASKVHSSEVATIYLGGTFGCAGTPLAPLANATFLPLLQTLVADSFQVSLVNISPNLSTQDSSQATPKQLAQLYMAAQQALAANHKTLLVIQGTDTLSHSAAFFAYACAAWDMQIVFLASMQPLLVQKSAQNTSNSAPSLADINPSSDAIDNLNCAIEQLKASQIGKTTQQKNQTTNKHNVWLAVNKRIMPAINTQKTHRTEAQAFSFEQPHHSQPSPPIALDEKKLSQLRIFTYFCVPQSADCVAAQLDNLFAQKPEAVILIGYGAGNFPHSEKIQALLQSAQAQETLVVISSQVPFGSVAQSYAAGSWLHGAGVLSTGNLSIASCYAKLCWLCASTLNFTEKQKAWAL